MADSNSAPLAPSGCIVLLPGIQRRTSKAVKRRLLLVEDDVALVGMLTRFLSHDFDILAATDRFAALAHVDRGEIFDAVLMDVRTPGPAPEAFIAHVRASDRTRRIPVVLMSGNRPVHLLASETDIAFVPKPLDPDELLSTLLKLIE